MNIEYTQGICNDGAAILKNGKRMTIEEILSELSCGQEGNIPQDVEKFIADNSQTEPIRDEYGDTHYKIDVVDVDDLRTWMTGHVRVPVEVLETVALALIPLANAAMPVELEMLSEEDNERAYAALDLLRPLLSESNALGWLNASKGE